MILNPNTSEIEAINLVLRSIQEAPITNPNRMSPIALQVKDALNQAARTLFLKGYTLNTDEMELSPDNDQEIKLPADSLSVEIISAYRYDINQFILRNNKIYDRIKSTYKIDSSAKIRIKISRWLPWNERPENANQLIIAKAALDMSREKISDNASYSNLLAEYQLAERRFLEVESRANTASVFDNSEMYYDDPRWAVYTGGYNYWR